MVKKEYNQQKSAIIIEEKGNHFYEDNVNLKWKTNRI